LLAERDMKKKIIIGIIAAVFVFAVLLLTGRIYFPTNVAATAPDHTEAALRTRRYRTDLKTFAGEVQMIIPKLSTWGGNWKHVATEEGENGVLVRAEVPVVVFTDDLQIIAVNDPSGGGGIIVNVYSKSRVGKSDFGENRRHVLRVLEALDAKFAK
jgi:uncharacterized protein (DUF1499 family)